MKKVFKIFAYILGGVVLLLIVFLIYFNSTYPKVDPPTDEKVEVTPARLERGGYLANHVAVCIDCHSTRDWSKFSGPITSGTFGKGGDVFNEDMGLPGTIYAKNITPAALSNWSDGELIRAITCGVSKDGSAFFPIMPYNSYTHLTKEDLYSIVAYIRSLEPIENQVPASELNFPLNLLVKTMPLKSYNPSPEPDRNNPVQYGEYLVKIGGCFDCHTPSVNGEYIMEKAFAGGGEFSLPGGILVSANLTPDKETGLGSWTAEQFVARFKSFDPDSNLIASTSMTDFNTPMPWTMYAGMTSEDLSSVFAYLQTLKPIHNAVTKWTPNKNGY